MGHGAVARLGDDRDGLHGRRAFLARLIAVTGAAAWASRTAQGAPARRMTLCLNPGAIGVQADQRAAIDLAHRHGFESVEPFGEALSSLSPAGLEEILDTMRQDKLVFGAAGLPVEFRRDDGRFGEGVKALPRIAAGLQRAGVTRVGTWLSPAHDELAYAENLALHVRRLREVAKVLDDHGLRLGLEYVGTPSLRKNRKHAFVHSLVQAQELIAGIGARNVGVVLDTWHWHMARESVADLKTLTSSQVVAVDLNDAPAGVALEDQADNRRELPGATGVIDVAGFLGALGSMGFDGPLRAEPFNQALNALDNEAACAATIQALRRVMALSERAPQ
jgi:sugar phosphate isomerase/epimerase